MLGSNVLYLEGMWVRMFQLSCFYYETFNRLQAERGLHSAHTTVSDLGSSALTGHWQLAAFKLVLRRASLGLV